MHALLVGLHHRERKDPVGLDAQSPQPGAVGDAGAQIWDDRDLRVQLVRGVGDGVEHRRGRLRCRRFLTSLSDLERHSLHVHRSPHAFHDSIDRLAWKRAHVQHRARRIGDDVELLSTVQDRG